MKSINHICQNVPLNTAEDMATEVVEALNGNRDMVNARYLVQNNISRKETTTITNISKWFEGE
jgi:hypothetical protein